MADSKDIQLLLKATDLSSQTFQSVAASVQKLSASLVEQAAAAAKGDVSSKQLYNTLRQLDEARAALARQNADIESFKALEASVEKATARADAAKTKFAEMAATQAGAAEVSKVQANALIEAGKASDRAEASLAKQVLKLAEYATRLEVAGLSSRDLAAADEQLVAAATQVGASRALASEAINEYDNRLKAHKQAVQEAADAEKAAAAATKFDADHAAAQAEEVQRETAYQEMRAQADTDNAAHHAKTLADRLAAEQRFDRDFDEATKEELQRQAAFENVRRAAELDNIAFDAAAEEKARVARIAAAEKEGATAGGGHGAPSTGKGSQSGMSVLGLQVYQAKDLFDQLNRAMTGLVAGQSVFTTVLYEGGYVLEDFNIRISKVIKLIPYLLPAAVVIGTVAAALIRMAATSTAIRELNAQLAVSVDGMAYSGKSVVALQRHMQDLGANFGEAGKALQTFIRAGIGQADLAKFGEAALNLSKTFGIALPEAAAKVSDAFRHDYDAVKRLDDEYNFLSVATRKAIKDAFDHGDAMKAQGIAFDAFNSQVKKGADIAEGPLTVAFQHATTAVGHFLDAIANSGAVNSFLIGATAIIDKLDGVKNKFLDATTASNTSSQMQGLIESRQNLVDQGWEKSGLLPKAFDKALAEYDAKIAEAKSRLNIAMAGVRDAVEPGKGFNREDGAAQSQNNLTAATTRSNKAFLDQVAIQKELANQVRHQNDNEKIEDARRKAKQDAEKAGVNDTDQLNTLGAIAAAREKARLAQENRGAGQSLVTADDQLRSAAEKSEKDSLEAQLKAIDDHYAQLAERLAQYKKDGGTAAGLKATSFASFEADVAANEQILKLEATRKYYDNELKTLEADRTTQFKELNDAVAAGTITAAEGYEKVLSISTALGASLKDNADKALAFGLTLQKTQPGPTADAFVARARAAQTAAAPGGALGTEANTLDQAGLQRIDNMLKERNDLAAAWKDLQESGTVTSEEAAKRITAAYTAARAPLLALIDSMQALIATQKDLTPAQLSLVTAQLAKLRGEATEINPELAKLRSSIGKQFATEVSATFSTIATDLGSAIDGTEKWGTAFRNIEASMLHFFSSLLENLAKTILEKQLESAFNSATSPGTAGGGGIAASAPGFLSGAWSWLSALFHEGGIVGQSGGASRAISPLYFANAPRFHDGTIVGLSSDEQAAILQRGEQVLSKSDPRNVLNRGGSTASQPSPVNIRSVLVMDPSQIPNAMLSSEGEKVTLSHIRSNLPTIRTLVGAKQR
jgi:hypothetical protein